MKGIYKGDCMCTLKDKINVLESMIVLDLDKTLLNSENQISEYTVNVLAQYKANGGQIVIATGRAITRSRKYAEQIGAVGLITLNGSVTYCNNEIIAQTPIDKEKVYDMVQRLMAIDGMSMSVCYPDYMITSNPKFAVPGVNDYNDMKEFSLDEIQNIKAFSMNYEAMDAIDYDFYGCRKITSQKEEGFHVIACKDVDKINGIKVLCDYLGISIENTIAFGDDYNDLQMLKQCGIGVAMANASEMVKDEANTVALSNNEDGVGVWLNQYFNLNI